jgi:hypothetical protein
MNKQNEKSKNIKRTKKDKILARIRRWGRGCVFTPKDFVDLASRGSVDMALKSLTDEGTIRRVLRGIYDFPMFSKLFNEFAPTHSYKAANTIARQYNWRIIPHGSKGANDFHLSTQVPAKMIFVSDGPTKTIYVDNFPIYFKHVCPKEIRMKSKISAYVIQAMKYMGEYEINTHGIETLKRYVKDEDKQNLARDAKSSVDWIYRAACKIAGEAA